MPISVTEMKIKRPVKIFSRSATTDFTFGVEYSQYTRPDMQAHVRSYINIMGYWYINRASLYSGNPRGSFSVADYIKYYAY